MRREEYAPFAPLLSLAHSVRFGVGVGDKTRAAIVNIAPIDGRCAG